jgi:hypothetical protein
MKPSSVRGERDDIGGRTAIKNQIGGQPNVGGHETKYESLTDVKSRVSSMNGPDKNEGSLVGGQAVTSGAPDVVGASSFFHAFPCHWSTGVQHNSMPVVGSSVTSVNGV